MQGGPCPGLVLWDKAVKGEHAQVAWARSVMAEVTARK